MIESVAVGVPIGLALARVVVVAIALRGSTPAERPDILRALRPWGG